MSPKEKILAFVTRLDDNLTREELLYKLDSFLDVELGLKDLQNGRSVHHDELFEGLLQEDSDLEESQNQVVRAGAEKSPRNKDLHSKRQPKSRSKVHKEPARGRKRIA